MNPLSSPLSTPPFLILLILLLHKPSLSLAIVPPPSSCQKVQVNACVGTLVESRVVGNYTLLELYNVAPSASSPVIPACNTSYDEYVNPDTFRILKYFEDDEVWGVVSGCDSGTRWTEGGAGSHPFVDTAAEWDCKMGDMNPAIVKCVEYADIQVRSHTHPHACMHAHSTRTYPRSHLCMELELFTYVYTCTALVHTCVSLFTHLYGCMALVHTVFAVFVGVQKRHLQRHWRWSKRRVRPLPFIASIQCPRSKLSFRL